MQTEKMRKIDPHVHSNGVSRCSRVSCSEIIEQKIKQGYDGAMLTNHCQAWYYPAEKHAEAMRGVVEEYERGLAYAKTRGFEFWLGIEVTIHDPFYSDWLLYGATAEFLLRTPCLYQLNQKELFALCEENGVLLVQAHPFRDPIRPADPKYLHGLEINCTPGDLQRYTDVLRKAEEYRCLVTCGTDYHGPDRTFRGGTFVPDHVRSATDFAEYLRLAAETKLFLGDENLTVPTFRQKK